MHYQDHLTKFFVLRALTSKRAVEVACQLLDIFLMLGAPSILQSDNGSEFTAQIIVELKQLWPRLVIVHGKPRHRQSQGSVGRANIDVKDMLTAWLSDNNTTEWAVGLKFVQFQKRSYPDEDLLNTSPQLQQQNQHQLKLSLKPDKKKFRLRESVLQNPSCNKLRRW
ncbi:hypothetical protein SNE40_013764 [Patella caerulea]|uniref:Integrase catalytic domain-containing protein n=1 Tax=Patella caerulea TaxID=87958 RepID=A0AAN8JD45_PATCE